MKSTISCRLYFPFQNSKRLEKVLIEFFKQENMERIISLLEASRSKLRKRTSGFPFCEQNCFSSRVLFFSYSVAYRFYMLFVYRFSISRAYTLPVVQNLYLSSIDDCGAASCKIILFKKPDFASSILTPVRLWIQFFKTKVTKYVNDILCATEEAISSLNFYRIALTSKFLASTSSHPSLPIHQYHFETVSNCPNTPRLQYNQIENSYTSSDSIVHLQQHTSLLLGFSPSLELAELPKTSPPHLPFTVSISRKYHAVAVYLPAA